MAKTRPGRAAAPARRGGSAPAANRLLIMLTGIALIPFSLPTVLLLFCGMLPTLGAAVGDRGPRRYAWLCVGGLNFAGLSPWLFALWFGHHTLDYAFQQLMTINLYLTSFGAAAVGWLLYLATPPVVSTILAANSQRHALQLASQQRKLIEQWGPEVAAKDEPDLD